METFLYYAGKALFEYCLQKYNQHQRDKEQVETKELSEKYQEKMAKKNAIIRELEEENKFLASEGASLAEENQLLKKKFRGSQGTTKEDKECKKLKEEIQRFHEEIDDLKIVSYTEVAKETQKQNKKLQEAMEKYMQKMCKKTTP